MDVNKIVFLIWSLISGIIVTIFFLCCLADMNKSWRWIDKAIPFFVIWIYFIYPFFTIAHLWRNL